VKSSVTWPAALASEGVAGHAVGNRWNNDRK